MNSVLAVILFATFPKCCYKRKTFLPMEMLARLVFSVALGPTKIVKGGSVTLGTTKTKWSTTLDRIPLVQMSSSYENVCGTTFNQSVHCLVDNIWKPYGELQLKQISLSKTGSQTFACAVSGDGKIFCNANFDPKKPTPWNLMQGENTAPAVELDAESKRIYMVNEIGFHYSEFDVKTPIKWVLIPSDYKFKQISVSGGRACGISEEGALYCTEDAIKGKWIKSIAVFTQFELREDTICGINAKDSTKGFYCGFFNRDQWIHFLNGSPVSYVTVAPYPYVNTVHVISGFKVSKTVLDKTIDRTTYKPICPENSLFNDCAIIQ